MKNLMFVIAFGIMIAGCGPNVKLNLKNNDIAFKNAGGRTNPERGLDILDQQAVVQTRILLQEELRQAIKSGNQAREEEILKMMEQAGNIGGYNIYNVGKVKNYTDERLAVKFENLETKAIAGGCEIKAHQEKRIYLPYGEYSAQWFKDGKKIRQYRITVKEGKIIEAADGKKFGWITWMGYNK